MLISIYKLFLVIHEPDFQNRNYKNIELINSEPDQNIFSFAVIGTVETSVGIFKKKIISELNSNQNLHFIIAPGNVVLDGAEEKYRILNNLLNKLNKPTFVGLGERELSDGGTEQYYNHFGEYYYSFYYGNSYFIFLDTTGKSYENMQKNWITEELNKADAYQNVFVFLNDSPLEAGTSDSNLSTDFGGFLKEEFSTHNVDIVFYNGKEDVVAENSDGVLYYSNGNINENLLKSNSESLYQYYVVNVSKDSVGVETINKTAKSSNFFVLKLETILEYFESVIYFQFINFVFILSISLLVILYFYKKISKEVDYYRNFDGTDETGIVKDNLKIAMFTNNYFPFIGGVPISIDKLAESLRKRGNTVEVFAPKYPGTESDDKVFRCKLFHYRKGDKFNFAIANIYSNSIIKEFIKKDFDIVHVHHPFWMGTKGLNLGKDRNLPVILTYHTRLEMYSDNIPVGKLLFKNVLSHKMIKRFAQKCDGIIAPTVTAKEYLENIGVSRQKLVHPTGVDFRMYEATEETIVQSLREKYAPNGEILICSVSRLSVEKNIEFLIRGLEYVKRHSSKKFKCIIIGKGPEKDHLEKVIEECDLKEEIMMIGAVQPSEIAAYYMASDLFAFSSRSETQGMVLLEAMAGKCPVVSVNASGIDDVVKEGFNGFKTQEKTENWADKIIYLMESPETLKMMSENAYTYSLEYSMEKMAEKIENFYKSIITAKYKQKMVRKDGK